MSDSIDILMRFADATIGYNGSPVLEHVNLEIRRGSFIALLGPNGSGKSTVMKTLVGILPVLKGHMEYPSSNHTPRFGYVPQRDSLDPLYPLTGLETVIWIAGRHLITGSAEVMLSKEKIEEMLIWEGI